MKPLNAVKTFWNHHSILALDAKKTKTFIYQEWFEAKPSDGLDILYTGAHRKYKHE